MHLSLHIIQWTQFCSIVGLLLIVITIVDGFKSNGGYSLQPNGTITTPDYPSKYAPNLHRIWLIEAPTKFGVRLEIGPVSGEAESDGNCLDYIEVRDGSSGSTLLLKSCSTTSTTIVRSTSRWIWIKFKANWVKQFNGFTARWTQYERTNTDDTELSPLPRCRGNEHRCPNKECVTSSWRCDGYNDCGYEGDGSDEDWWCFTKPMASIEKIAYGVSIGVVVFVLLILLVAWLDGLLVGQCGRCGKGPKSCLGLDRLRSGPRTRRLPSQTGQTPAMLLLTGQHDKFEQMAAEEWQKKSDAYEKQRRRASAISVIDLTDDLLAVGRIPSPEPKVETRPATVQRRGKERLQRLKSARDQVPQAPVPRDVARRDRARPWLKGSNKSTLTEQSLSDGGIVKSPSPSSGSESSKKRRSVAPKIVVVSAKKA